MCSDGAGCVLEMDEEGERCFVCFDAGSAEAPLMRPCLCNLPVHRSCLQRLVDTTDSDVCRVCRSHYRGLVVRVQPPERRPCTRGIFLMDGLMCTFLISGILELAAYSMPPRAFGDTMFQVCILSVIVSAVILAFRIVLANESMLTVNVSFVQSPRLPTP